MSFDYIFRNRCPLCLSAIIKPVGQLKYYGITSFSSNWIDIKERPELWRCTQCNSGFVQYCISETNADELYALGNSGMCWKSNPFSVSKTKLAVMMLNSLLKPGLKVLDIGANTGELLDFAKRHGCFTAGVEFS